jgi:gas vesicle protein GvpN
MATKTSSAPQERSTSHPTDGTDSVLNTIVQRAASLTHEGLNALEKRAQTYLQAGYPLHLRGPAGSGKTTLALRIAEQLKRPVVLLVGDANFDTRRLVGGEEVTHTRRVVDRYISTVMKVDTQTNAVWLDRALSLACLDGCTLVYDEFNRAPAVANNVLLTVLEERMLVLPKMGPKGGGGESYLPVHPEFRAIFTSNPVDHVGTNLAQDALLDRMITLDLEEFDRDIELAIVVSRSGLKLSEAGRIVDIVRDFRASRAYTQRPSLRASIMIARIAASQQLRIAADEPRFSQLCIDVLGAKLLPDKNGLPDATQRQLLTQLIDHFCVPTRHGNGHSHHGVAS